MIVHDQMSRAIVLVLLVWAGTVAGDMERTAAAISNARDIATHSSRTHETLYCWMR
jgi:hypothetical protein